MGKMIIGYSVPTIMNAIVKLSQDIASEAQWIEHYACCEENATQIYDIDNCVSEIGNSLVEIKVMLENLKGEEIGG